MKPKRKYIHDPGDTLTRDDVYKREPWAARVIREKSGWMVFESIRDMLQWEGDIPAPKKTAGLDTL